MHKVLEQEEQSLNPCVTLRGGADGESNNTICARFWCRHEPAVYSLTFSSTWSCAANQERLKLKQGDTQTVSALHGRDVCVHPLITHLSVRCAACPEPPVSCCTVMLCNCSFLKELHASVQPG